MPVRAVGCAVGQGHKNLSDSLRQSHIALYSEPTRVEEPPLHHNDVIRRFDSYWRSLHARLGHFPARSDLDPIDMGAAILPWTILVELREDDGGVYFYYRLCGTEVAHLIGRDVTGSTTREAISGGNPQIITGPYFYTLKEACPSFWKTSIFHKVYHWRPVVRGVWPLSSDGQKIDGFANLTVPVLKRP